MRQCDGVAINLNSFYVRLSSVCVVYSHFHLREIVFSTTWACIPKKYKVLKYSSIRLSLTNRMSAAIFSGIFHPNTRCCLLLAVTNRCHTELLAAAHLCMIPCSWPLFPAGWYLLPTGTSNITLPLLPPPRDLLPLP